MDFLKVCFVGVGSIAKRHIKNLSIISKERKINIQIDAFRHNGGNIEGVHRIYSDMEVVPMDYDIIFITNPTDMHLKTLKNLYDNGKNYFIEKPVTDIDSIDEAQKIKLKNNSLYYVACPLRYNAVIKYIKQNIKREEVISVRSISSSFLPDWRPGQDYRNTYSAHKNMGGGVSIDLIHEWDYLTYLFGWPNRICSFIGKKSSLEIDSDDYAIYIAEFSNMIAEIHLDYFGRSPIREIELFTNDDTIVGDIINNKIKYLKSGKTIEFNENRDDYQKRELNHFLDMVLGIVEKEDGYNHGVEVLKLTQGKW